MRLLSTSLLVLATAAAGAQAATKEYAMCSSQQSQQYFSALTNEISQCQKSSTYDLAGGALPSITQRAAVCKCSSLLQKLPNIRVPRCKITLDGNAYKFKDAIESVFAECSGVSVLEEPLPASQAGSGADEEEETGGEASVVTTAPPKTNSTSSSASSDEEATAGSIDELPTTKPESTEEATTTEPPVTPAPTPAPTKSGAVMTTVSAMLVTTSAVVAVLLV